jgi:hypothetical protein
MGFKMPTLIVGRVYEQAEIREYMGEQQGSDEFGVLKANFHRDINDWPNHARPNREFLRNERILFEYQIFPLCELANQARAFEEAFRPHQEHEERIEAIVRRVRSGDFQWPVYIQKDDPKRRLFEAFHRLIAFLRLDAPSVPVFLVGWHSWFGK